MNDIPTESVVGAWIALVKAQQAAMLTVERAFRDAGFPPHSWYDMLWELDRAGDNGLRPFELEQTILIAQSNISRLIDRIEAAGYAQRRPCKDDGRGQVIAITDQGRDMRKRMWPVYAAAINVAMGANLDDVEASSLSYLLTKTMMRI